MAQPVIGLTLDHEPPGGYSKLPVVCDPRELLQRGAPGRRAADPAAARSRAAAAYLDRIDGLVVTGGGFDVDPALFGAASRHPTVKTKDRRTAFELAARKGALARDMPVLGICGGQQLLNVVLGGTLDPAHPGRGPGLPARTASPTRATSPGMPSRSSPARCSTASPEPTARRSTAPTIRRSRTPGPGVVIDAVAEDGVVEGIEDPRRRFCLGVQWHPEFEISEADRRIFRAFVEAAGG